MIASTSTLFLATLVFGAASVIGAPVRISDTLSESVARAVVPPTVEPVARAIVDVQDYRRRSNLGAVSRRAARVVYERDEPFAEIVTAREPASVVTEPTEFVQRETIQRRYPRRQLRDFYEKREPASTVKETTMVVSKTTVHDTPADAAAFNAGAAVGSALQPTVSGFTVKIPLPIVGDGSVQASTSTLLSVSSATTIVASSGTATSTATSSGAASGTASASATASATGSSTDSAAATATASVSASSTDSASATSTATSTDSASAATPTATDAADGSTTTTTTTSVVSADQPAASGAATDGTTSTTTTTDNTTGDDKNAVVAAVVPGGQGATTGNNNVNQPAITVNGFAPAGAVADQSSRRSVKVSTSPIARRRVVARSGASWASWARRQFE